MTLSQRPTLLAHIQRQSATEFALDQNREVFENARMDVGATQDMRCRASISLTPFSQSDWLLAWARRDQSKTLATASRAAGAFLFGLFVWLEQTGAGSPRYGRGGDIPNIFTSASPVQTIASARDSRRCRLGTAAVMHSIRGSGRPSCTLHRRKCRPSRSRRSPWPPDQSGGPGDGPGPLGLAAPGTGSVRHDRGRGDQPDARPGPGQVPGMV